MIVTFGEMRNFPKNEKKASTYQDLATTVKNLATTVNSLVTVVNNRIDGLGELIDGAASQIGRLNERHRRAEIADQ